jgi:4-hydroxy-3-polyprenylbenzoate decarboxylase
MSKDLRSFIKQVATTMPDQIQMITEEVDAKFGITAVAGRLAKEGKFPALYFTRVKGSRIPVVINLTASYERLALALGTNIKEMVRVYGQRQAKPLAPRMIYQPTTSWMLVPTSRGVSLSVKIRTRVDKMPVYTVSRSRAMISWACGSIKHIMAAISIGVIVK